jgi:phosphotransferase system HPr (HPr) family protein
MASLVVTIISPARMSHARTVAQFVKIANTFTSQVSVSAGDEVFDGKSILSLMQLSSPPGSALRIRAKGEDAADVLQSLHAFLENP